MKFSLLKIFLLLGMIFSFREASIAQNTATREVKKDQQSYVDSLKQVDYPYIFPFLGQQAYKRGFDLPYPAGLMGNFIWMKQGILIDNFQLGVQNDNVNIPLTPLDEFFIWGENTNTSYAVNFRPDLWVLPFLNVYGLFGYGQSTTEINLVKPVPLNSSVTQNMTTRGFGFMSGFGLGKYWVSVDANWTWTDPELLEDPVLAKVMGVRLGRTFPFASNPQKNFAFWVGGMRGRLGSETLGSIKLADALPPEIWDKADQIVADYNAWYDGLDPIKQGLVDKSPLPEIVDRIESRDGNTTVLYGMDKAPVAEWNMVVGGQFQLNKRWMARSEIGIIGDRKSYMASINYRFGI